MKKKVIIILAVSLVLLLLIILVLFLTGRFNNANNKNTASNFSGPGRMRQLDFGQPSREPDVRGVVKSIIGNEVTILKVDMPSRNNASSTPGQEAASNSSRSGATINLAGGARVPSGMGRPGEENNSDSRAQMLARLKALSTGEVQVVIPVGIQMLKFDTSSGKREAVEATLADITADKSVMIWTAAPAANMATSTIASTTTNIVNKLVAEFVLIN